MRTVLQFFCLHVAHCPPNFFLTRGALSSNLFVPRATMVMCMNMAVCAEAMQQLGTAQHEMKNNGTVLFNTLCFFARGAAARARTWRGLRRGLGLVRGPGLGLAHVANRF